MKKVDLRSFDYQKMGELDADMWRAYYNHQFFKLFKQMYLLTRLQLRQDRLTTLRLAYYSAIAAADYRINRKNVNRQRVLKRIVKFYRLVATCAVEPFDYHKTAELELRWWDVHRKSKSMNPELVQSLAAAAAAMYNEDLKGYLEYANYRAEAMLLPRHSRGSANNQTDWVKIKELTIASWKSLHSAAQKQQ